ncbi:MAG: hypothetical protein N2558_00980 [Patescibacteria group bacterium]|nr:hypothetical protein [Patescibacteria group bacterium]
MNLFPKSHTLMYLSALVFVLMAIMAISLSNSNRQKVYSSYAAVSETDYKVKDYSFPPNY